MWLNKLFIWFIKAYAVLVSPFLGSNCRFYPSCSCYCSSCLGKYSFFKAMYLSLVRLSKCHPWHPGGFDQVP